jgi:hypothetical protein
VIRTWLRRKRFETEASAALADAIVDNWIAQAVGPRTIGELTPAELGVWVVVHATEQIMLGELGEQQRDYTGHLLELAHRDGRTWVRLVRFRGEADEETLTRSFHSDTPVEVRR